MQVELGILKHRTLDLDELLGPDVLKEVEEWSAQHIGDEFNDFVRNSTISVSCLFRLMALACYYEDHAGFQLFYDKLQRNIKHAISLMNSHTEVTEVIN